MYAYVKAFMQILYIPPKISDLPALVVEMKWDKSAEGAIVQIKKRNYPAVIKDVSACEDC